MLLALHLNALLADYAPPVEVVPPLATGGGGAERRRRRKKRAKVYWEDLPADKPKPAPIVEVEAAAQEPVRPVLDVPELLELGREIRLAINDELEADDEDVFALVALL